MEISSAPYLIDPTQFGLDDLAKNQKRLEDIQKKYRIKVLKSYHDQPLQEYVVGPRESYIIGEIDQGDGPQIGYLAHLKIEHLKSLQGESVTQVEVWRKRGMSIPAGITRHVFFNVLLKRYKYVVSDRAQTERGRDFWFDRLAEADQLGFRIGIILDDDVTWKEDQAFGTWLRLVATEAWGKENIHYDTRLVIAHKS